MRRSGSQTLGGNPTSTMGRCSTQRPWRCVVSGVEGRCEVPRGAETGRVHMVDGLEVRGSVVTAPRDHLAGELVGQAPTARCRHLGRQGAVLWRGRRVRSPLRAQPLPSSTGVGLLSGGNIEAHSSPGATLAQACSSMCRHRRPTPDPLEELRAIGASRIAACFPRSSALRSGVS